MAATITIYPPLVAPTLDNVEVSAGGTSGAGTYRFVIIAYEVAGRHVPRYSQPSNIIERTVSANSQFRFTFTNNDVYTYFYILYSKNGGEWFWIGHNLVTTFTSPTIYYSATATLNYKANLWYQDWKKYKCFGLSYDRGCGYMSITGSGDFTFQDVSNAIIASSMIEGLDYIKVDNKVLYANIGIDCTGYGVGNFTIGWSIFLGSGFQSSSLKIIATGINFYKNIIEYVGDSWHKMVLYNVDFNSVKIINPFEKIVTSVTNFPNATIFSGLKNCYVEGLDIYSSLFFSTTINALNFSVSSAGVVTGNQNIFRIQSALAFFRGQYYDFNITTNLFSNYINNNSVSKLIDCKIYKYSSVSEILPEALFTFISPIVYQYATPVNLTGNYITFGNTVRCLLSNSTGNLLQNANYIVKNGHNEVVSSGVTSVDGLVSLELITWKHTPKNGQAAGYISATNSIEIDYNPFTITITKEGYQTYEDTLTITKKTELEIALLEELPPVYIEVPVEVEVEVPIYYHQDLQGVITVNNISAEVQQDNLEGVITQNNINGSVLESVINGEIDNTNVNSKVIFNTETITITN